MGATTMFLWLQLGNVTQRYRTALGYHGYRDHHCSYHYVRIFHSCVEAFVVVDNKDGDYSVKLTGAPFDDAYRYTDWCPVR